MPVYFTAISVVSSISMFTSTVVFLVHWHSWLDFSSDTNDFINHVATVALVLTLLYIPRKYAEQSYIVHFNEERFKDRVEDMKFKEVCDTLGLRSHAALCCVLFTIACLSMYRHRKTVLRVLLGSEQAESNTNGANQPVAPWNRLANLLQYFTNYDPEATIAPAKAPAPAAPPAAAQQPAKAAAANLNSGDDLHPDIANQTSSGSPSRSKGRRAKERALLENGIIVVLMQ